MSFSLVRQGQSNFEDIGLVYQKLVYDFCTQYYTAFDSNMQNLSTVYYPNSQFTYQDSDVVGFTNFSNLLILKGVSKLTHYNMHISSQPLRPNGVLISVVGLVSINDSINLNKFSETFVLIRDDSNVFRVFSTILKIFD